MAEIETAVRRGEAGDPFRKEVSYQRVSDVTTTLVPLYACMAYAYFL